jgi:hypothetical protein
VPFVLFERGEVSSVVSSPPSTEAGEQATTGGKRPT